MLNLRSFSPISTHSTRFRFRLTAFNYSSLGPLSHSHAAHQFMSRSNKFGQQNISNHSSQTQPHNRIQVICRQLSSSPVSADSDELSQSFSSDPAEFDLLSPESAAVIAWLQQKHRLRQDAFLLGPTDGNIRRRLAIEFCRRHGYSYEVLSITRDTSESDLKQRAEIIGGRLEYRNSLPVQCALSGRILLLDGIEKAERNVLPTLNNLLENREMMLDDGRFLMNPEQFDALTHADNPDAVTAAELEAKRIIRVHHNFRVIALGLDGRFQGFPLDPPLRSRFQVKAVQPAAMASKLTLIASHPIYSNIPKSVLLNLLGFVESLRTLENSDSNAGNFNSAGRVKIPHFPESGLNHLIRLLSQYSNNSTPLWVLECLLRPQFIESVWCWKYFTDPIQRESVHAILARFNIKHIQNNKNPISILEPIQLEEIPQTSSSSSSLLPVSSRYCFTVSINNPNSSTIQNYQQKLYFSGPTKFDNETRSPILFSSAEQNNINNNNSLNSPTFLFTSLHRQLTASILSDFSAGRHICLIGSKGSGKSRFLRYLFSNILGYSESAICVFQAFKELSSRDLLQRRLIINQNKNNAIRIQNNNISGNSHTSSNYDNTNDNNLTSSRSVWCLSELIESALSGGVFILDGIDRVPGNILNSIKTLIEDREITLINGGKLISQSKYTELFNQYNKENNSQLTPLEYSKLSNYYPILDSFRFIAIGNSPSIPGSINNNSLSASTTSNSSSVWLTEELLSLFSFHDIEMPIGFSSTASSIGNNNNSNNNNSKNRINIRDFTPFQIACHRFPQVNPHLIGLLFQFSYSIVENDNRIIDKSDSNSLIPSNHHSSASARISTASLPNFELDFSIPTHGIQLSLRQILRFTQSFITFPNDFIPLLRRNILFSFLPITLKPIIEMKFEELQAKLDKLLGSDESNGIRSIQTTAAAPANSPSNETALVSLSGSGGSQLMEFRQLLNSSKSLSQSVRPAPLSSSSALSSLFAASSEPRPELIPNVKFHDIPQHIQYLQDILKDFLSGEKHLLLIGMQGVAKNRLTDRFLMLTSQEREYMQFHRDLTIQSMTLIPKLVNGEINYEDSALLKAMKFGRILVLDEVDKAPVEVTACLKGLIEENGEMQLSDGRRIVRKIPIGITKNSSNNSNNNKRLLIDEFINEINGFQSPFSSNSIDKYIEIHPNFKCILLANRIGAGFHGNNFYLQLGDLLSSHSIENPDIQSEISLLSYYGPNVDKELIMKLVLIFNELREMVNQAVFQYPYSTRELIAIVKHLNEFPHDSILNALENVLHFDIFNAAVMNNLIEIFTKHGIPLDKIADGAGIPYNERIRTGNNNYSISSVRGHNGESVNLAGAQKLGEPKLVKQMKANKTSGNFGSKRYFSTNIRQPALSQSPVAGSIHSSPTILQSSGPAVPLVARRWLVDVRHSIKSCDSFSSSRLKYFSEEKFHWSIIEPANKSNPQFNRYRPAAQLVAVTRLKSMNSTQSIPNPLGSFFDRSLLFLTSNPLSIRVFLNSGTPEIPIFDSYFQLELEDFLPAYEIQPENLTFFTMQSSDQLKSAGNIIIYSPIHSIIIIIRLPPVDSLDEFLKPPSHRRLSADGKFQCEIRIISLDEFKNHLIPTQQGSNNANNNPDPSVVTSFLDYLNPSFKLPKWNPQQRQNNAAAPPLPRPYLLDEFSDSGILLLFAPYSNLLISIRLFDENQLNFSGPKPSRYFLAANSTAQTLAKLPNCPVADGFAMKLISEFSIERFLFRHRDLAIFQLSNGEELAIPNFAARLNSQFQQQNRTKSKSRGIEGIYLESNSLDSMDPIEFPVPSEYSRGWEINSIPTSMNQEISKVPLSPFSSAQAILMPRFSPPPVMPFSLHIAAGPLFNLDSNNQIPLDSLLSQLYSVSIPSPNSASPNLTLFHFDSSLATFLPESCLLAVPFYGRIFASEQEIPSSGPQFFAALRDSGFHFQGLAAISAENKSVRHVFIKSVDPSDQDNRPANSSSNSPFSTLPPPSNQEYSFPRHRIISLVELPRGDLMLAHASGFIRVLELSEAKLQSSLALFRRLIGSEEGNKKTTKMADKSREATGPKKGKMDGLQHQGGNTFAGGSGGADTPGLGGVGGSYRLAGPGETILQVSDEEKAKVSDAVKKAAREAAQRELLARLSEIDLSPSDNSQYERYYARVDRQIIQLKLILEQLEAKSREREWMKNQINGEIDESKLVDLLVGDRGAYKRRGIPDLQLGIPQMKKKKLLFLVDCSASMYRFENSDQRLTRLLEICVLIMESLESAKEKFIYSIVGHSGDDPVIPLVSYERPPNSRKEKLNILQRIIAHTQYCSSGDNTLSGLELAIRSMIPPSDSNAELNDDYIVIAISDANFGRYNISPADLARILTMIDSRVHATIIFIAQLLSEASVALKSLPVGKSFFVEETDQLPALFRAVMMDSATRKEE